MAYEIQFKPDRLYEIVRVGMKDNEHIHEVENVKKKALALFEVKTQPNGTFDQPDYYILFEHSSEDDFLSKELVEDDGIKFADATVLAVPEPVTLNVRDDKYYEFFAAWVNDGKHEQLQKFFEASQPIKEKYGKPEPLFLVQFQSTINSNEPPYYTSSMAGLVEWDHYSDVDTLLGNEDFQALAAPLFGEAISRMEMILGKVVNISKLERRLTDNPID